MRIKIGYFQTAKPIGMTIREFNRQKIEPTSPPKSLMVKPSLPPLLPVTEPRELPQPMSPRDPVIQDIRPAPTNFGNLEPEHERYPPIGGPWTAFIQGVPRDMRRNSCK